MSRELVRAKAPMKRRYSLSTASTMTFPRALREAIPDLPTCVGRVLELSSVAGAVSHHPLFGPRVSLKLGVRETGKLKGQFTVRVDLEAEAAKALAETILRMAEQLSKA
jgi:prephenate dehydrogenase